MTVTSAFLSLTLFSSHFRDFCAQTWCLTCEFLSRSYSPPQPQSQVAQCASIFKLHLNSLYKAQPWLRFIHFPFYHHTVPSLPIFSILLSLCVFPSFLFFYFSFLFCSPPCTEPTSFSCMAPPPISIVSISSCSSVLLDFNWFSPLSLSLSSSPSFSLTLSFFHSLCFHLGDSGVHAASNLSHCLSGCSVYALCDSLFLSSLLSAVLHCIPRLSSAHISISPHSRSLFPLPLPASLSPYALFSLLCIAALCSAVWENTLPSHFFRARAECTSATGGRGIRCSWSSRFDFPWIPWICVSWRGGEGRKGRRKGAESCSGESFVCLWK